MRFRSEAAAAAAAFLAVLVPALPAVAATYQSDVLIIDEDVGEDLYATARRIVVSGRIDGDLLAAAAEEVAITGTVTGSVTVLAPRVVVAGAVDGSVRGASSSVSVGGRVGGDVVVAALDVDVSGLAGRDVLAWANRAEVRGTIGRDLRGSYRRLALDGDVGGDVEVDVGALALGRTARVEGDLAYRSPEPATGSGDISGVVVRRRPLPTDISVRAGRLLAGWLGLLGVVAVGLLVTWLASGSAARAEGAVRDRRVAAPVWGLGAVSVLLAPPAVLVAVASAGGGGVGFVVIALLLGVVAGVLTLLSLAAGLVPAATALGGLLVRRLSPYGRFLLGVVVIALAALVPVVGLPLVGVAALAGLGGWILGSASAA